MREATLLILLGMMGCATSAAERERPGPAAMAADSVVGVVRVVGSAPVNVQVVVQGAEGTVVITGPARDELRSVAGAEVVARGRREGGALHAEQFDVRSVDGQPVVWGTVEALTGEYARLRTREGESVYLVRPPGDLRVGQRVWVQGPRSVIVQSYGVVRP